MEEKRSLRIYKIIMLLALVIFITFLITSIGMYQYFIKNEELGKQILINSTEKHDIASEIKKYEDLIERYYLGEIDEEKLREGAIKGYIEGLGDPYTEYISKDDMKEYMESTRGNFVGIGIYMVKNIESNRVQILSPIKNSPAEKNGILPGDLIISVDDVEYTADDMSVAATKIKGEEGTTVKIKIYRESEYIDFEIKRESIKVNPVESKILENNIGYIVFSSFDENTAQDFKTEYEKMESQGITSLIIDLRNNGGGMVREALNIANYFTDKGSVLLYEADKNNNEKIEKAKNDPIIDMPVIILTNENTASSSEILAGALKDLGKAKIVGTKTFGKGVIQEVLTLRDGSGLKITSQKYLTPNRKEINEIGIEPDVEVSLPDTVTNVLVVKEEEDTQLQKAIEILNDN